MVLSPPRPKQKPAAVHPLVDAFAPLADVVPTPGTAPRAADGEAWRSRADLLAGGGAELDRLLDAVGAAHATRSRSVAARFFVDGYAWFVAGLAVAGFVSARRVPDLSAGNVLVRIDRDGSVEEIGLRRPRFACLPDDLAARHPDATVVGDLDALRRLVRESVVGHLTPLMVALRARSSLSERSLWLGVADHCVRLYLLAAMHLDPDACRAECEAETTALIQSADSPLAGPTGVIWIGRDGPAEPWIKRAACCLGYHVPEHGRCDHCPAYPIPERIARVGATLAANTR